MKSALRWYGNLSVTGRNCVPTLEDFELDARYLYEEKWNLIVALERWLNYPEWNGWEQK